MSAKPNTFCIWGSLAIEVFAVGGWILSGIYKGGIIHFDSNSWQSMAVPGTSLQAWINVLRCLWGTSFHDVYAVGEKKLFIAHPVMDWADSSFQRNRMVNEELYGNWNVYQSIIFAVGTPFRYAYTSSRTRCIMNGRVCW